MCESDGLSCVEFEEAEKDEGDDSFFSCTITNIDKGEKEYHFVCNFDDFHVNVILEINESDSNLVFQFIGAQPNTIFCLYFYFHSNHEEYTKCFSFVVTEDNNTLTYPLGIPRSAYLDEKYFNINNQVRFTICIRRPPLSEISNSRVATGHVGIVNQGATCYMNSVLQCLFHIPAFRRLVYKIPFNSIPVLYYIQKLFVQLQVSDEPACARDLTRGFGWDENDAFMQHDIHEFLRKFIDTIESGLKKTEFSSTISNLFRGRYSNQIKAINIEYFNEKIEDFYDLSVVVNGCKNLFESLDKFTAPQKLDGADQYRIEGHGLQDVYLGTEFKELPTVLFIHLSRFEFNTEFCEMTKVNDYFEFPKELDLRKYLDGDNVYELYGVLVHLGDVESGHFFCYLRTEIDSDDWYMFDDENVTKKTEADAINNNFGNKNYSAYMLVYIRKSEVGQIYAPISKEEIPESPSDIIYIRILNSFVKNKSGVSANINKTCTEFYDMMNMFFDQMKHFRIWYKYFYETEWGEFDNFSYIDKSEITVKEAHPGLQSNPIIYLEELEPGTDISLPDDDVFVFISLFVPQKPQKIMYIGSRHYSSSTLLTQLAQDVTGRSDSDVYKDYDDRAEKISGTETLKEKGITNGTHLILQTIDGSTPDVTFVQSLFEKRSVLSLIPSNCDIPVVQIFDDRETVDTYYRSFLFCICDMNYDKLCYLYTSSCKDGPTLCSLVAKALNYEYDQNKSSLKVYIQDPNKKYLFESSVFSDAARRDEIITLYVDMFDDISQEKLDKSLVINIRFYVDSEIAIKDHLVLDTGMSSSDFTRIFFSRHPEITSKGIPVIFDEDLNGSLLYIYKKYDTIQSSTVQQSLVYTFVRIELFSEEFRNSPFAFVELSDQHKRIKQNKAMVLQISEGITYLSLLEILSKKLNVDVKILQRCKAAYKENIDSDQLMHVSLDMVIESGNYILMIIAEVLAKEQSLRFK